VKYLLTDATNQWISVHMGKYTTKEAIRAWCLAHAIIRLYIPFSYILNKITGLRNKVYVNWNKAFFVGLISGLAAEEWNT